ncbi:endopeptidase La [bacterium]|nr:endopeptidase La [bacterium]
MTSTNTFPLFLYNDIVVFPFYSFTISVEDLNEYEVFNKAFNKEEPVVVAAFKKLPDDPEKSIFLPVATLCDVLHIEEVEPGKSKVVLAGAKRVIFHSYERNPKTSLFTVKVKDFKTVYPKEKERIVIIRRVLEDSIQRYFDLAGFPPEKAKQMIEEENLEDFADCCAASLDQSMDREGFREVLEEANIEKRILRLVNIISTETNVVTIENEIDDEVHDRFERSQREQFLREKIRVLNEELNGSDVQYTPDTDQNIGNINFDINSFHAPEYVKERLKTELTKAARIPQFTPEQEVIRNYIETIRSLPWEESTECEIDIERARKQLDNDHYGLSEVKDRILEYLAVLKLSGNLKAPIICLAGPPGVGKTSIASSLAAATGRKFIRQSLGGLRDEAEIRGHRRTYLAAMPGKIILSLQKAKVNNPLFLLDEIDKLGADYKGDPSSALLEVLDPEQNKTFTDHFLDLEFDLSNVLFVATANDKNKIPVALKDRMEVIDIDGYTAFEKKNIAKNHLIPKEKRLNGIEDVDLEFTESALDLIIKSYTCESGVRELQRKIASVCRKIALAKAEGKSVDETITEENIKNYLGVEKYSEDTIGKKPEIGVVNGLAWTPYGGTVLKIEAIKYAGKGGIEVTGSLGDVMKESVKIAGSYIRALFSKNKIVEDEIWDKSILHIHFPDGATPKDGPSAGGAISLAIASLMSGIAVSHEVAMTGEVSLKGKILKIGGLKAKVLAAKQAGIKKLFIPEENRGDFSEIPDEIKKGLDVQFVTDCAEILKNCLPGIKLDQTSL